MRIALPTEADTTALAAWFAKVLNAGDTLLLQGPIGAGKSFFARALIRSLLGDIDVPSPTFTLVQTYETQAFDIWHADLYRLTSPDEVVELGLDAAFETAVCLVEWPDRLGELTPDDALLLELSAHEDHHLITAKPSPIWAKRLEAVL